VLIVVFLVGGTHLPSSSHQAIALKPENAALYEARAAINERVNLRESLEDSMVVIRLDPSSPKVCSLHYLHSPLRF